MLQEAMNDDTKNIDVEAQENKEILETSRPLLYGMVSCMILAAVVIGTTYGMDPSSTRRALGCASPPRDESSSDDIPVRRARGRCVAPPIRTEKGAPAGNLIGQGGFGSITVKDGVVIKTQHAPESKKWRMDREIALLNILKDSGCQYFPALYNARVEKVQNPDGTKSYTAIHEMEKAVTALDGLQCSEKGTFLPLREQSKPYAEDLARLWFCQIAYALNTMHEKGWAHNDMKPDNILLTNNGVCLLADFGLSRPGADKDTNIYEGGDDVYLSPEKFAFKEGVCTKPFDSKAADMWALGVTFYKMLVVGNHPFQQCRQQRLPKQPDRFLRILERRPVCDPSKGVSLFRSVRPDLGKKKSDRPSNALLSDGAWTVVSKLLEKDPTKRATYQYLRDHEWLQETFVYVESMDRGLFQEGNNLAQYHNYVNFLAAKGGDEYHPIEFPIETN